MRNTVIFGNSNSGKTSTLKKLLTQTIVTIVLYTDHPEEFKDFGENIIIYSDETKFNNKLAFLLGNSFTNIIVAYHGSNSSLKFSEYMKRVMEGKNKHITYLVTSPKTPNLKYLDDTVVIELNKDEVLEK